MGTVMVVDDSDFMRSVLKKIIRESGHEVVAEACNGQEAINLSKKIKPNLIFMDIVMQPLPNAKNGIEALVQIVTANPSTKIVMCSSMGQQKLITRALKSGAVDFVIKPFQTQQVLEVISKYC